MTLAVSRAEHRPTPALLATEVAFDAIRHRAADSMRTAADSARDRVDRGVSALRGEVRNEAAPLILIAVIAVAAAVALIVLVGLAIAWLHFCQQVYGRSAWPTVGVPSRNSSYYFFGCRVFRG